MRLLFRKYSWLTLPARDLQTLNASGWAVEAFQGRFNEKASPNPPLAVDGLYGPQTVFQVSSWQRGRFSLAGDGFIGPISARALRIRLIEDSE